MAPQNPVRTKVPRTDVPDHLIFQEVLQRFPIESLLRFRSVSRRWNSEITSVEFSHTHFRHTSSKYSNSVLALQRNDPTSFTVVDYEGLNHEITKYPKGFNHPCYFLLSTCNGLALLISSKYECEHTYGEIHFPVCVHRRDFGYLVCNPVIGSNDFAMIKHPNKILLGGTKDRVEDDLSYSFGFGHVSSSDDYFIVLVNMPLGPNRPDVVVYTYSLRLAGWKIPRKFKQKLMPVKFHEAWFERVGTLVEETLYWVITRGMGESEGEGSQCVAAFDLATQDTFKLIKLPVFDLMMSARKYPDFGLCCMDGCLCCFARLHHKVEMWKLTECGECDTWTKIFCCSFSARHCYCCNFFGFNPYGKVLILAGHELLLPEFIFKEPQNENSVMEILGIRFRNLDFV